jgi:hypothetical protein
MSKELQIGSDIFNYPDAGEAPGWGEDATAWAEAVTEALSEISGPNDIPLTSANLNNNQTSVSDVTNFKFNIAQVQSVNSDFFIIRTYDSGSTIITETGKIYGSYDGNEFFISVESTGDTGVSLSITNAGQIQYTSTNLSNHVSSIIRFKADTIDAP